MSRLKTFKWNLIFQFASIVIAMISGIILMPFYLKTIPENLYGAWLATGSILVWIGSVDPGISGILQQKISQSYGAKLYRSISIYVSSGLTISFFISIFLIILGIILKKHIPSITGITNLEESNLLSTTFLMVVIGTAFSIISFAVVGVNQGLQNSLAIGVIYVVIHLLDILLLLVLLTNQYSLIAFGYSSIFRGAGMLISNAALMFHLMGINEIEKKTDLSEVGEILRIAKVTAVERLSANFSCNYQPFLVAKILNLELVPILAISKKIIDIMGMIITRPGSALAPSFSHAVGGSSEEKLRDITSSFFMIMTWLICYVISGLICFNGEFIRLWVGEKYYIGNNLNLLLCLALMSSSIVTLLNILTNCYGNFKESGFINILQNILIIGLGYIGCKFYGLFGLIAFPIIPLVGVGIPYFWGQLKRNNAINSRGTWELFCQITYSLVAVLFAYFIVALLKVPDSWIIFTFNILVFSIAYFLVLVILSSKLRNMILLKLQKLFI